MALILDLYMKIFSFLVALCGVVTAVYGQTPSVRYSNNFNFGMSYTSGFLREPLIGGGDTDMDFLGLQFDYVGLFHVSQGVAVGAGTGIRHLFRLDNLWSDDFGDADFAQNYFSVPLYLQGRFRFIERRVSPLLVASAGYNFRLGSNNRSWEWNGVKYKETASISSGFMVNLQAGVDVKIGRRINISGGPYVEYRQGTLQSTNEQFGDFSYSGGEGRPWRYQDDLHLIEAGLKVGMAF
ncbi:hypothetical protein BC792_11046 [Sphingobacterium allocomposti]|uniref:Outer membrane protein with beta-barrel domain n=2 Tax=Sphingobacterium allocomposti TaxID=415956 RepID=A0A5S5DLU1_9SPHI|nr:hypothetical protein BC792_11046 [Sphingobacterium composti Yoo et al. 2007 non Ten et al. 2007]